MAESPESRIEPYEGLDEMQRKVTGESLPKTILEICDKCHWCTSCINEKGALGKCPACGAHTSKVMLGIDEVCHFEQDRNGNVTLRFERKLPMR